MGSFANSLHLRISDADRVAKSSAELLAEKGWRSTQKAVHDQAAWNSQGTLRGVQISAPRDGWVSILDTDLMGAHTAVAELAQRLATHAIFVFVDDSDSWSYLLADAQGNVSEFESGEGAGDDEDFDDGDMLETSTAIAQLQSLMRDGSVLQRFQQVQQEVLSDAPPEIREAEARLKRGQGTSADMQRYQSWAMQEMPKHMAQFRSMLGDVLNLSRNAPRAKPKGKSTRQRSRVEQKAQQQRINRLRPLLAPGVTDQQVQEILDKRDLFAENVLAEFLPLLGISEYYASLSYRYLGGVRESELTAHNIRFVHHLRFETSRPGQSVHS